MLFSDQFSLPVEEATDWFDPNLSVDTKLFVDPFLIFQDNDAMWSGAHDALIAHFQAAFKFLAEAGCQPEHLKYKAALRLLTFPEPSETCLGYTARGVSGSGGGPGYAKSIASAMCDAIGRGLKEPRHFEELGILEEGIGPDRISDMTCTVLKPQLVAYTQAIAKELRIPLAEHRLHAGRFDAERRGFVTSTVQLPTNPASSGAVLLVPRRFLRALPTLNADDWWEDTRSQELRDEFNLDVMDRVNKKMIVRIARAHPDKVRSWVEQREKRKSDPYDLKRDPLGVYGWEPATKLYVRGHPEALAAGDEAEFLEVIDTIIRRFKHYVEQEGGWKLLWDGENPKPEEAAQLLFLGVAKSYCEANNIDLNRETELGRGPVDFKFSTGFKMRALLEVKKLENGKFWHGLKTQLPTYLESDSNRHGWLLAIRFRTEGVSKARSRELPTEVAVTGKSLDLDLHYAIVDARPKTSASKASPTR